MMNSIQIYDHPERDDHLIRETIAKNEKQARVKGFKRNPLHTAEELLAHRY